MRYKFLHATVAGVLIGLFLARWTGLDVSVWYLVLILSAGGCARFKKLWPIVFLLIGCTIGAFRAQPILNGYDKLTALYDHKQTFAATIFTDPVYHESGQLEYNANNLRYGDHSIDATLRIRSFSNDLRRGDRIEVSGKLRDGFASWQGSMYFAEVELLSREPSVIDQFRAQFISQTYTAMPDPESSLGLGFLLGIRALLPEDLNTQLAATGLTHIVAVSGYNLTILANVARRVFGRFSRFQAVALTLLLLAVFVSLTGMSPSVTRALVVSAMSLGAWYYGHKINPWILLLYSSAISAFIQPAYAWFSIGWYLSLLAFWGVLILAPAAKQRIYGEKEPRLFMQIVMETSAAQMATMPLIMMIFGEISLIALIANALVLPFIPIAMLMTLLSGAAMFVHLKVATLVLVPTYFLLQYITSVIRALAAIDWSLQSISISVSQMVVLYVCLGVLYVGVRKKQGQDLV